MELLIILVFVFSAICRSISHGIWHNHPKNTYLVSERYFHAIEVLREGSLIAGGILFAVFCKNWMIVPIILLICWETFEIFYNKQRKDSWIPRREKLVFLWWGNDKIVEKFLVVTGWGLFIIHAMRLSLIAFFAKIYMG